ncbi:branched-chain amino acid ABC transporter permease [Pimelobacter sp. 30-1]|uniref:branched-chain amino acid ABC transporter permease n=1 Tax=Pimelobacter sp. 30-1 TaxID=2004991 RepID=UPI001C0593A9|nr:branched-chain amino acid ABC transporter permease [Pimelobacter sp. 30-1]MBU2694368.1 hypothetical protein [Pimelobacter sp. 30-1]
MDLFWQRVVDAIADGSIYAGAALALIVVFRATRVVNFAQGEMAMLSAFVVWALAQAGLPIVVAMAGGVVFGGLLGAVISRCVMRPFAGGDHLREVMVTLGLFLVINAGAAYLFTTNPHRLASPFPQGSWAVGGVQISYQRTAVLVSVLLMTAALSVWLHRTSAGLAMRAVASSPASAELLGVDVRRTQVVGWAIAGAVGALTATLVAPSLFLSTAMMGNVLIYAFAAAALGGLDSVVGAVVGGLFVGLVQNLAGGYVPFIGNELKVATALTLIVVILLVRPQGIFGTARVERV